MSRRFASQPRRAHNAARSVFARSSNTAHEPLTPITADVPAASSAALNTSTPRAVVSAAASTGASVAAAPRRSTSHAVNAKGDGFVDARALASNGVLESTLSHTVTGLGVSARPKVVGFRERLQERKRAYARSIALRVGAALLAVTLVAGVVWGLFFSPLFFLSAREIHIQGANQWVSARQIYTIASQQVNHSLLVISTDDIVQQLKAIPGVVEANASKQFPHGLQVSIVAKKPAAMLRASGDHLTAVDGFGRVLNAVTPANVQGIPIIQVDSIDAGLRNRAVLGALNVLNRIPEPMRQRMSAVAARTQDSLTTELDHGAFTIVWGDQSDLALKYAIVDKLIHDPAKIRDKHHIDVSAPLRPIIK